MYSSEDVKCLAFMKLPYLYEDICFIHPLSIKEVLSLGSKYDIYLKILTLDRISIIKMFNQKKIEIEPSQVPDPFEFLLDSALQDDTFLLDIVNAFRTFIQEEVIILCEEKQIIIGSPIDRRIINSKNFGTFSNTLRIQNKMTEVQPIIENEDPRAKKFREKRELRDAIKQKQESANAPDLSKLLSVLCTYGGGITPFNIGELSLYAFYDLTQSNGSKERYEMDMNMICAGADANKVKPKHWITEDK